MTRQNDQDPENDRDRNAEIRATLRRLELHIRDLIRLYDELLNELGQPDDER